MQVRKIKIHSMVIAIFLLSLGIRLLYWQFIGIQAGSDSPRYVDAAQALIHAQGNPATLITIGQPFYFWLYPLIIALVGGHAALVVFLQIALQAIAAVLMYKIGKLLFSQTTGIIAGLVYAVFWEAFQWDVYILTDSVFLFLVVALFYNYALIITSGHKKQWWWMAGLLIAALLERPHGLVVALVFLLAILLRLSRRMQVTTIALTCIGIALYGFALSSDSVNQNLGVYQGVVTKFYADGVVIDGRPAYNLPVNQGLLSIIKITLHRVRAFWFIYPMEFATSHKLLNALFLIPLYSFGLYGALSFSTSTQARRAVIRFMVCFIIVYTVAASLTNVDYDWRLRLPVWPFVIMLASYGFVTAANRLKLRNKLV